MAPQDVCAAPLQSPKAGGVGNTGCRVEAGAEDVAGDALHLTLVTSCSEPRQMQQRLLVSPGMASGLPMKVLPDQGHATSALLRPLSLLQLSLLVPAQDLPEDGCPLPFRAQSRLWVTCAHHRW